LKKIASIFLILLFLFGSTEAYQLLKLPMLVNHFIKHKHEDASITFIGFLKMHYKKKIVVDDDFQQDMQLPFKTNDADGCLTASISLPSPRITIDILPTPVLKQKFAIHDEQVHPLLSEQKIFQPPRLV
jgi:hypothetical protein